jgi:hypothetical protein
MTIFLSAWVLPLMFIMHDFEEMIVMPIWKRRHHRLISGMDKPFFGPVGNGQAFTAGVLEEMCILLTVSLVSGLTGNLTLYLVFCVAYTAHFIMHFRMCAQIRGYVPGAVSAALQTPVMLLLIVVLWRLDDSSLLVYALYQLLAFAFVVVNLKVMHRLMPRIESAFLAYAENR